MSPDSEVVLPTNTFIATAETALPAGCQSWLDDRYPALPLIDTEQSIAAVGPVTEAAADRMLPITIPPWITASQQETVAETLTKAVG